jgi:hypothetical protein
MGKLSVFVPIGVANLTQDSVILCEQIRVIDKSRIIRVIGHLDWLLPDDRSPSEVNHRLQIIVRAILAGESISVVSQERNLSGKSLQPQDKIRAESLR